MTGALPADLVDGLGVTGATPVSGGDIAQAFRLETADGPLFAKTHPDADAGAVRAGGGRPAGAARAPASSPSPRSCGSGRRGLVLEWIDVGGRTARSEPDLGARLAALHRVTGPHFGGLDGSPGGYLGSQPVDLTPTDDWAEFFLERRVRPLTGRAVELGRIDPAALGEVERIAPTPPSAAGRPSRRRCCTATCGPATGWSTRRGVNWLIDPAAYWGHREVDLAMMQLFGGFGDAAFAAYDEAFPLAAGWRDRVELVPAPAAAGARHPVRRLLRARRDGRAGQLLTTATDTRIDTTITADGAA